MKGNERDRGTGSRRRRGAILAALALLIAVAPAGLFAIRDGATLRLRLLDGRRLEGELLAVKGEELVLMGWSGSEARVAIGEVAEMRIERGNRVSKGLVGGLAVGFALGTLIALPSTFSHGNEYWVLPVLICGGLGGGFGAIIGTVAGVIGSGNDTIRPQGRDAAWRTVALQRLRRLARFREPEGGMAGPGPGQKAAAGPIPAARRWVQALARVGLDRPVAAILHQRRPGLRLRAALRGPGRSRVDRDNGNEHG